MSKVRPHKAQRHSRPYVALLAADYRRELEALLTLLSQMDADKPYALVGEIMAQRARVSDLRWRIFRACGYSDRVTRSVIK